MRELIDTAEKIALDILKPSKKQLEHGLELHKNSVVCDAYGFSPKCAVYGGMISEAALNGASPAEIQNMAEEFIITRCVYDEDEKKEYMIAWERSGVTCVFQCAGEEEQSAVGALKRFAHFTHVTDMLKEFVFKAVIPDDIEKAKKEKKHCLYMTSNTVPLAEDRVSVEEELQFIKIFFNLGVRMMHVTYNRRNLLGDGCVENSDAGLSDFGREAVREMNRAGVIVDAAHSGQKTTTEAMKASSSPAVISHAACAGLNSHVRCKTDEAIKAAAGSGGYTGIVAIPSFLGMSGDINAFLSHIDYAVRLVGTDHVAVGTDKPYVSSRQPKEADRIPQSPPSRKPWKHFWPADEDAVNAKYETTEHAKSLSWTNWPLFTVGLVMRGYSDDDIQKIIGGNVLRVARGVLGKKEA